jgi:hypothetical protein
MSSKIVDVTVTTVLRVEWSTNILDEVRENLARPCASATTRR